MQDVSTARTWTLAGQSVRFGMLFTYTMTADGRNVLGSAHDPEELSEYLLATRLPGACHPNTVESMSVNSIYVGDFIEAAEVLPWFREECKGKFELHFAEVEDELSEADAAEGLPPRKEFKFFFRFHEMSDALRFKLKFGHVLDAGLAE